LIRGSSLHDGYGVWRLKQSARKF